MPIIYVKLLVIVARLKVSLQKQNTWTAFCILPHKGSITYIVIELKSHHNDERELD